MILTVTLNAALDVTYLVDRLVPRASHRVDTSHERAGGKGVNVSRVLARLGHDTLITGLAGGPTGRTLRAELQAAELPHDLVPIEDDSRRTVTVVSRDDGDATVFNQAGPRVRAAEWTAFTRHFAQLARGAKVVVLSGSLPPGLPENAYAGLLGTAAGAGAATVLDTSGAALREALTAGPDVVKPNAAELLELTGTTDVREATTRLRTAGARTVIASLGPDGLHADTPDGRLRAIPPERLHGNPTGAGDACVAALAAGLAQKLPWADVLRDAVALSAAAVPCPMAGDIDADVYRRLRTTVPLEELDGPAEP